MDGIGLVIQANAPLNTAALEKQLAASNTPKTSHTVLNAPEYAAKLKREVCPQAHIYCRNYDSNGDENDLFQYSPKEYFDKYQWQTAGTGLGLQIPNEPGFGGDVIARAYLFMKEAERRNIPISIGGFSVGITPDSVAGWAQYDAFVQYLCARPDLFTLDAHEYGLVVPTYGMVTANTGAGDVLYFTRELLRIDQWPKSITELTNMYGVGRIKKLFDYAASKGYPKPVVDIGESLIDFVSDVPQIDAWGKALPSTNPNKIIGHVRGYKSLTRVWEEIVAPGFTTQETYAKAIAWARTVIYDAIGVRSMRLFTWGNSGAPNTVTDWVDFDVNTDPAMQAELFKLVSPVTPPPLTPTPDPVPVPTPTPTKAELLAFADDFLKLAGVVRDNAAGIMDMAIRFKELVEG